MVRRIFCPKEIKCSSDLIQSLVYHILKDITHRVIQSGEFHKKKIQKTLSDAINIEVVSIISFLLFIFVKIASSIFLSQILELPSSHTILKGSSFI